jgi:hypothetical protein
MCLKMPQIRQIDYLVLGAGLLTSGIGLHLTGNFPANVPLCFTGGWFLGNWAFFKLLKEETAIPPTNKFVGILAEQL